MNLWFAPQVSEHSPYRRPGRLIENLTWFSRPGVASVFTPNLGNVHECNTFAAGTIIRIGSSPMFSNITGSRFQVYVAILAHRPLMCVARLQHPCRLLRCRRNNQTSPPQHFLTVPFVLSINFCTKTHQIICSTGALLHPKNESIYSVTTPPTNVHKTNTHKFNPYPANVENRVGS
jgi:hypothetical protein